LKLSLTRSDPWLELPAMEVSEDDPLVQASLSSCRHELGVDHAAGGVPYCTDANILTGYAGIPSIVLGPGSIDQAHAPEEWVNIDQIRQAASIYVSAVQRLGTIGEPNAS
jgi:succinyl-diaminopimelate desuccinylase